MRAQFIWIAPGEAQFAADRLMRLARVRHLPVVDGGRLVGMLSHRDLLESELAEREARLADAELRELRARSIGPLVRSELVSVAPGFEPARAAELMLRYRIGFLPVVEQTPQGPRLVGIVTESDLLRLAFGL